jgi:hypothetical protein
MSDLSNTQAAQTVKLIGADSTGLETNHLLVGSNGAAQVMPPVSGTGLSVGELATSSVNTLSMYKTAYTEQTTNAQRSFASSSANDAAAGTGARTIVLTYLDQTGAGPYTETITLNGTSNVNTVNTNICFVESIVVATAGSGLTNAGIITMKAAIAGGGVTIATVAIGDNRTKWTQHYVPLGKTCYIADIHASSRINTATAGAIGYLTSKALNFSNAFEKELLARFHYIGTAGTVQCNYYVPFSVVGPARVLGYIVTEANTANTHYMDFSYFEI